jgi:hypothetical protein
MAVSQESILYDYMGNYLASDGDALTQRTCANGCTTTAIICAALTESDDYWNDALIIFDSDTATSSLQNQTGDVTDFDQGTTTLTLAYELPAAPANTDTFRLVLGGKIRSSNQINGMTVDAGPTNITGVTIDRVAYSNEAGDGTLYYTAGDTSLAWKSPDDVSAGTAIDVSGSGAFTIHSATTDAWITATVVAGSLPIGDQSDTITISNPDQLLVPDMTATESEAKTARYWAFCVYNSDGVESALTLRLHVTAPDGTATTLIDSVPTTAGHSTATDISDWLTTSFWVYNSTKSDIRYCFYRSGNELYYAAAGTTTDRRGFTAVTWDPGDTIKPYPEIDIAVDEADGYGEFTNLPSTLTYTYPVPSTRATSAIFNDNLSATTGLMVGIREINPENGTSRADILNKIAVTWE